MSSVGHLAMAKFLVCNDWQRCARFKIWGNIMGLLKRFNWNPKIKFKWNSSNIAFQIKQKNTKNTKKNIKKKLHSTSIVLNYCTMLDCELKNK